MDMEEENALKEFLVGALCGKNDQTSYLYFHVAEILPIQNLVENMVWTIFYDQPNKRRCNQITMGAFASSAFKSYGPDGDRNGCI